MLSVLPFKTQCFWQSWGNVAQVMIEEIKKLLTQSLSECGCPFFPSFFLTTHKFVRIVYGQLFHLSAVMAGINRPLNTGSCEFSILWLAASGITVVILI